MLPLTVPSPIATPATVETDGFLTELGAQVEMQGGLISDHAVRLEELSPALFEMYNRDIGELFTRSQAVREEIFSHRIPEEVRRIYEVWISSLVYITKPGSIGDIVGRFWNGLPRMGRAEMVDQA
ncbi:hypothetical protein Tco_0272777, partial [Tanacetum coccineum]